MIIVDTGPIVAATFDREEHHEACVRIFDELRMAQQELTLPATVLAEVGYMLRTAGSARQEVLFLEGVADGDFTVINFIQEDLDRVAELARRYSDHPLGVTDASIVAIAERLGINEIVTLNARDFRTVVPRHVQHFTLLPETVHG